MAGFENYVRKNKGSFSTLDDHLLPTNSYYMKNRFVFYMFVLDIVLNMRVAYLEKKKDGEIVLITDD